MEWPTIQYSARSAPQCKRHLASLSRFCRAHCKWQTDRPPRYLVGKIVPLCDLLIIVAYVDC